MFLNGWQTVHCSIVTNKVASHESFSGLVASWTRYSAAGLGYDAV